MKRLKRTLLLACTILAMVGCLDNTGSEPTPVVEVSSTSYFSIANQSGFDLNVRYNLHVDIDSMVSVSADSTALILKRSGVGGYPTPSQILAKLSFYSASGDTASPTLVIEPVVDGNWNDVTAEEDTVKKYELVITEEDIK